MYVSTKFEKDFIMAKLEEVIDVLTEVLNLDPENRNAKVTICGKYLFITRQDQDDGYYIELK